MNNLIIGANSFLGKEICKQLLIKKNEIVAVYNKNTDNLLENIRSISIKEMFLQSNNYDIIYIVSAYIPKINDDNIEEKLQNANVNLVSKICQKFPNSKIIYCSSVSVYKVTDDVIYEKSETNPDSLYGKSKLQGEEIVKMQKKHSIVRIASMFGIGMKESTFLPAIINCAIKTKKIHLIGNGSRLQNYISVKDVANYLIESSKSNNNTYLAVSEKSYSNKEIAGLIQNILPEVEIIFSGKDNSNSYIYENSLTRNILKIKENTIFTESLKELIKWQSKK